MMKRVFIGLLVIICATGYFLSHPNIATAVSGSDWQAGQIIQDSVFFNKSSMTSDEIQAFLNAQLGSCDTWGQKAYSSTQTRAQRGASRGYNVPYVCLKDYQENPTTHETNLSTAGSVSGGLTAAQIIKYAADTYGINPKVLIVLLQKEQGLVTDDWPWSNQYKSATGYGCPDTAPCDAEYYGFYNQVTNAAAAFKRYANNPQSYRYKAGQNNDVLYNPAASCSSSSVYLQNQATTGLYTYTPYQPNQAALNDLYGTGDSCSAYGNRNFWRMWNDWFGSTQRESVAISYKSHVSSVGWMGWTSNDGVMGTTGQSKTIEAFKINGEVEYSSYDSSKGWQPTVNNGMISGTTGLNRPIQAIKISPTGTLATEYDIYYRVHVSYVGWMGWTSDGQAAGVTGGASNNIEAIQIQLVPKGSPSVPSSAGVAYQNIATTTYAPPLSLSITSHVGGVGWQAAVRDEMTTGTTEQSKRIEAIKITLNNSTGLTGNILYSAHVASIGWQDFVPSGSMAGTTGEFKQMEAIRIALTGQLGDTYDVSYRGYVQYLGWLNWAKNGSPAGSVGSGLQLEALEIRIRPKDAAATVQQNSLYNPSNQTIPETYSLKYSAHESYVGWVDNFTQNSIGGTTGQSKPLEAIKIASLSSQFGGITLTCSASPKNSSWINDVAPGNICGTTGQNKPLEAIKLNLTGDAANKYDLYYKVHLSYAGWQDWVKNGEQIGTPGSGKSIEAIVVKLVQKY